MDDRRWTMNLNAKVTCPACGSERALSSFQLSDEIMEISRLAARFGKNWAWTEEYLHCFRGQADKPLRPARAKIILEEILKFIEDGGFSLDKQWHTVRANAIYEAIRHVAQTNKTGFRNHNYLKKVAIDFNRKMIEKEEKEQGERAREAALRRDPRAAERVREMIARIGDQR